MEATTTTKRVYGLDILRAFAIIYVMHSHGYLYSQHIIDFKYYYPLILDGVGLFFVLSGFLIGGILLRTISEKAFTIKELSRFWIRRWFRTLPNYYLVLIILIVCYYAVHHSFPPKILQYFSFTQCFASPHPLFFGEAWSLAVEEWFYLLIPAGLFAVLFFAKGNRKYILGWILFVLVVTTFVRIFKVAQYDYFADASYGAEIGKQVITRMDAIMYGMLGAWFSMYKRVQWLRYKMPLFVMGLILLFGSEIVTHASLFYHAYFYYSVGAIGTLCILPMLSTLATGKGVSYKIFTFISIISYSMYLTNHMIVQQAIMPRLLKFISIYPFEVVTGNAIALMLFWLLTIVISYLLYRFWEQPMMKLRDRFKPR